MKTLATLLAAAALSFAALPPAPARACGDTHQNQAVIDRATATVEASFAAIAAGDTKAAKKQWAKRAIVTSVGSDGTVSKLSVKKALPKWIKQHEGMTWTIEWATETSDGAEVHATVTWNGVTYDDVLQLKTYGERLVIVDKTTTARAPAPESFHY